MKNVKIFSTPTCPHCIHAKAYLTSRGISYENVDVSADEAGLQEMMRLTGQMGVPVLVIDGEVIVGFDKARIDAKLGV